MDIAKVISDPNLALVLQVSAEAQEQATKLADYIQSTTIDNLSSPAVQINVSQQVKTLNASLSQLRGLHRHAHLFSREVKRVTALVRQQLDDLHLELQNLYYEQRHLHGEIAACESYEHPYRQLPLIPVEEFLGLEPDAASLDENSLMIARIKHELAEREQLEQQRQELLKRKLKLMAENKKRKEDLAGLDKDLEKFIDAAKPIQKIFEKVV